MFYLFQNKKINEVFLGDKNTLNVYLLSKLHYFGDDSPLKKNRSKTFNKTNEHHNRNLCIVPLAAASKTTEKPHYNDNCAPAVKYAVKRLVSGLSKFTYICGLLS